VKRSLGLDFIRASAVIFVIISHTEYFMNSNPKLSPIFHFFGFIGVEIFFTLSGFLIGRILIREKLRNLSDLVRFWKRRWFRTLPAYLVALLLMSLIQRPTLEGFTNVLSFTANLFPSQTIDGLPFFGISWTLAVEEWFYLLTPIVLLVFRTSVRTITSLWILAIAFRIALSLNIANLTYDVLRGTVILRFDAFLIGFLLAACVAEYKNFLDRNLNVLRSLYVSGLLLEIFIWLKDPWIQYESILFSLFLMPINSLVCAVMIFDFSRVHALRNERDGFGNRFSAVVQIIATLSYSMYLYHLLVIDFIKSFNFSSNVSLLLSTFGIVAVSSLSYLLIEKPFIRFRDRNFP
jgi:peptidoglycan/LPS O-acetylase OafA/YrhL